MLLSDGKKFQTPNPKLQMPLYGIPTHKCFDGISSKELKGQKQNPYQRTFSVLEFGVLILFGTWRLGLGASSNRECTLNKI
jgi:hypothetical protein